MSGSLPLDLMVTRSYSKDAGGSLVLTDFDVWVRTAKGWDAAPKPSAAQALKPFPEGVTELIVRPMRFTIGVDQLLKENSHGDSA